MMKVHSKVIPLLESEYINLSEQLREELELKIENLYVQNHFKKYVYNQVLNFRNATKTDFSCACLIENVPRNYVLSGKLLQGIKTWLNMYHGDRLSVINKFRTCYHNVKPRDKSMEKYVLSIVFCRFLINELLGVLAKNRWQTLVNHADYFAVPSSDMAFVRSPSNSPRRCSSSGLRAGAAAACGFACSCSTCWRNARSSP